MEVLSLNPSSPAKGLPTTVAPNALHHHKQDGAGAIRYPSCIPPTAEALAAAAGDTLGDLRRQLEEHVADIGGLKTGFKGPADRLRGADVPADQDLAVNVQVMLLLYSYFLPNWSGLIP